jgi:uncharacterized protein YukE
MATGFVGADVQQLKDLAAQMTGAGESLATIEGRLTALVSQTRWTGHDASAFMSDWHRAHRVGLRTVTQTLRETAVELRRNAAEQEAASHGGGGASGSASGSVGSGGAAENLEALEDFANDKNVDPSDVAEWWNDLSEPERAALISTNPELVGNMEGIDYTSRSEANHENLDNLIDAARDRGDTGAEEYLKAVQKAAEDSPPMKQIMSVDGGPPPLAAIAVGNLDKAEYTTFLVPGMTSNDSSTPRDLTATADDLRAEQLKIARANGLSTDIAVVAWMAYDSPEMASVDSISVGGTVSVGLDGVKVNGNVSIDGDLDVFGNSLAKAGGDKLNNAITGYDAYRDAAGIKSQLNVVAHSYGSTTAAYTLADLPNGVVNTFVTLGSAGIDPAIGGASGLNVPKDGVFAIQGFEALPAAEAGRLVSGRDNPADSSWGATRLNSDFEVHAPSLDPRTWSTTQASNVHDLSNPDAIPSGYLEPGTTSLKNTALVGMGMSDAATRG